MSVNVMNGLQASFLKCEPTEVFLHGCHTRVSVPVLVNISCAFILDGFACLQGVNPGFTFCLSQFHSGHFGLTIQ